MLKEICIEYFEEIKRDFDNGIQEARSILDTKEAIKVYNIFETKSEAIAEIIKRYEQIEKQNS